MDFERFLQRCRLDRHYADQIRNVVEIPPRPARFGDLSSPLPRALAQRLGELGIERLYTHQVAAVEAARRGEHVAIATSTASGKTLCYNVPVLEHWQQRPDARALYLFPTKALAQDQLRGLQRLAGQRNGLGFVSGTYDGDTPSASRTRLRDRGHLILTNPDMLHQGILPNHTRWAEFFSRLRYVVVDELHTYRGIFGSNVANVLRRLARVVEHHGGQMQVIGCSATIANPAEHAEALIGAPVTLIDEDGAPRGPRRFVLWNPPLADDPVNGRRSPNVEAQALMTELVRNGVPTICFTRARVVAELLYRYVRDGLLRVSPGLADKVKAYRAGYLAEERRSIEQQLFSGDLLGVTTTNALELGIDVGGLDACLIVGYPGSIASCWQQAGRAGRAQDEALVILIGRDSPIDQYLMAHPDYFFGQSPEHAIIDPQNTHILLGHLRCAVSELPMSLEEAAGFGEWGPAILDLLAEEGQAVRRGDAWFWSGQGYPAADISLRTVSEDTYNIIDVHSGRVMGTVDGVSAFAFVHDQAIYIHQGETWYVERLDLTERSAYVRRIDADYYTTVVQETRIRLDRVEQEAAWRNSGLGFGDVTVTLFTPMFRKVKFYGLDSLGYGTLDLPPVPLETSAAWLVPPDDAFALVRHYGRVPAEGMLGIANVLVDILPLYVLCDPADIGCVVDSANHGRASLFVYDRYPGGLGFAHKAYELMEPILEACVHLVHECACDHGCPSCVGSTARNFVQFEADGEQRERIPDKEAALMILHHLLGLDPYVPKEALAEREAAVAAAPTPVKPLPDHVADKIRRRLRGRAEPGPDTADTEPERPGPR